VDIYNTIDYVILRVIYVFTVYSFYCILAQCREKPSAVAGNISGGDTNIKTSLDEHISSALSSGDNAFVAPTSNLSHLSSPQHDISITKENLPDGNETLLKAGTIGIQNNDSSKELTTPLLSESLKYQPKFKSFKAPSLSKNAPTKSGFSCPAKSSTPNEDKSAGNQDISGNYIVSSTIIPHW
jgi:hypothetical protein